MIKLIKNVRLIDPENEIDRICNILIEDGKIAMLLSDEEMSCCDLDDDEIVNAKGMIAAPGLVDVHVHFRDPGQTHKEDIHTGALSAAAGGYTSVVMMANTAPCLDSKDVLEDVLNRAKAEAINIYACCNATYGMNGDKCCDYKELKSTGAIGITDDGKPIINADVLRECFLEAVKLNLPVSLHEENPEYISENGVNSGEAAKNLGLKGSDRMAEISMIERDVKIALETNVKLNIQHISTKEGVEIIRQARKESPNIHAEATPHHFSLTDSAVSIYGTHAKMNPPLRKEEDRQAIIEAIADGTIEIIATDHAPHSPNEKGVEFSKAPSGIIGLETALPLAITNLVATGKVDYKTIINAMSVGPAKLYGIKAGNLAVGNNADIVIFDPNEEYEVKDFKSKSVNSPFVGSVLKGKVKFTICGGNIVYRG